MIAASPTISSNRANNVLLASLAQNVDTIFSKVPKRFMSKPYGEYTSESLPDIYPANECKILESL